MRATEKAALAAIAKDMSSLADDMLNTANVSAPRADTERLLDQNSRLLAALKELTGARHSKDEREKAHAHYRAVTLICEIEGGQ